MRARSRTLVGLFAVLLLAATAAIAGVIYVINQRSVDALVAENARTTSEKWVDYFARNISDVEAIASGASPSPETVAFIKQARSVGDVTNFKMFTPLGVQVIDSSNEDITDTARVNLAQHKPEALAAIKAFEPFVEVREKIVHAEKRLVAETYVPLLRDGRLAAILEVYVDQTRNAALFRGAFSWSSIAVALLGGFAFAIPGFGFFWRTRQMIAAGEKAAFLARHDPLTGLPNRTGFAKMLSCGLSETLSAGRLAVVHVIDVDHFKEINDRHGNDVGDELLRMISMRLSDLLRKGDAAARLSGNEFVLAQFGFESEVQVDAAVEILKTTLQVPYRLMEHELRMTFSVGTVTAPTDGRSPAELVRNGSTAMRVAKSRGRNAFCRFRPEFDAELQQRLDLEELVRDAAESRLFELHYQPLFDVNSAELKGFEALLRLRKATGEFVPPAVFIPVAEDLGLIDEIGTWVLQEACATAATWPSPTRISVNLSAAQFRRQSVCLATRRALETSGLDPRRLYLEITESLLLDDSMPVLDQLTRLKAMGVSIVMDDFGSGYSSLGYMLKFPFDRIKIDRSFITGLNTNDTNARNVVQTIIALGHTLNMTVTAEGVETLSQANALREMRCDDAQGYLFGKPIPATEVAAVFMRQFSSRIPKTGGRPDSAGRYVA